MFYTPEKSKQALSQFLCCVSVGNTCISVFRFFTDKREHRFAIKLFFSILYVPETVVGYGQKPFENKIAAAQDMLSSGFLSDFIRILLRNGCTDFMN